MSAPRAEDDARAREPALGGGRGGSETTFTQINLSESNTKKINQSKKKKGNGKERGRVGGYRRRRGGIGIMITARLIGGRIYGRGRGVCVQRDETAGTSTRRERKKRGHVRRGGGDKQARVMAGERIRRCTQTGLVGGCHGTGGEGDVQCERVARGEGARARGSCDDAERAHFARGGLLRVDGRAARGRGAVVRMGARGYGCAFEDGGGVGRAGGEHGGREELGECADVEGMNECTGGHVESPWKADSKRRASSEPRRAYTSHLYPVHRDPRAISVAHSCLQVLQVLIGESCAAQDDSALVEQLIVDGVPRRESPATPLLASRSETIPTLLFNVYKLRASTQSFLFPSALNSRCSSPPPGPPSRQRATSASWRSPFSSSSSTSRSPSTAYTSPPRAVDLLGRHARGLQLRGQAPSLFLRADGRAEPLGGRHLRAGVLRVLRLRRRGAQALPPCITVATRCEIKQSADGKLPIKRPINLPWAKAKSLSAASALPVSLPRSPVRQRPGPLSPSLADTSTDFDAEKTADYSKSPPVATLFENPAFSMHFKGFQLEQRTEGVHTLP
ncbi:hypothetical protein FB451DRAFT_1191289 [Mycena latifolia]|nr:hypothetical protein FB451DRAFT_1191289 [Mycena latifolia]